MGIFDRTRDQANEDLEGLPKAAQPFHLRASPQGWKDLAQAWPPDKRARFETLFPYPSDAVAVFQVALEEDASDPRIQTQAGLALTALRLTRSQMPSYKGTQGAFVHLALERDLGAFLERDVHGTLLKDIGLELFECPDPDLASLGRRLLERYLPQTHPGTGLEDLREKAERAKAVQEMMFQRVQGFAEAEVPTRTPVSGLQGEERERAVDPDQVISLDKPIDRVPEPKAPGPGRRLAQARREILEDMREEARDPVPEALPVFPKNAAGAAGSRQMTAQIVFQTLLEECLKDGQLTPLEMRVLGQIRKQLGLDLVGHEVLLRRVQEQLARNPPPEKEDLDPLVFFERLCRQACDDGRVEGEEKRILGILAKALYISADEFHAIRDKLVAERSRA